MKNGIEAMIRTLQPLPPKRRTTQARTGFYTAASAIRPKKPTLQRERLVSGVTATQQTATASGQPVKSSKPPKADRSTLKKWRT